MELNFNIQPLDEAVMAKARERQAQLAKPPGSLGRLEDLSIQLAGITGKVHNKIEKKHLLVFAADNGVVAEGVSSAPQSVTLMQTINLTRAKTGASTLCKHFGCGITVCDVGVNADIKEPKVLNKKIAYGTQNIVKGPAMTREQTGRAILIGYELAKATDADVIGIGEMGIGNTTTSSAVLSALLEEPVDAVTGRGGGITDAGFLKKKQVIKDAIAINNPNKNDVIDVIAKAQDAASTENTEKVENVTPENVKPEDKADLEKAKTDLEKALEDNGGNYTEEEKKSVEDEIDRIEAAVAALENAEDATASIAQLPESVEPDDEAAAGKILATKEAFDGLTDHEKSLVDEASREKLDELVAALIAYDIIKGDGSEWIKGSDGSLSFTANGPFSKFVGIEVDGEEVDAKHYEAKSGSTIITLKQSFLMNLAAGEHTLTVIYTDGETSGTFRIHTKSLTPTTGDDSRILLYASMLTVSLAALAVLLPAVRKRKKENS